MAHSIDNDFDWFVRHYPAFQKTYGDCFIAIKDKRVIGVFENYSDGYEVIKKQFIPGSFIIQECSTTRKAYIVYLFSPIFVVE